jgi:hypothetical protein
VSQALRPSLLRRIRNSWRARGRKPGAVDILPDGLNFSRGRDSTRIRWDEVTQIDGGVRDSLSIDLFFVVIHARDAKVTIDEFDDGFRALENSILERWPEVRERFIALQCGAPHQPLYETLWRR